MANSFNFQAERVGKIKGEFLEYAIPKQCIDIACTHFTMDQNRGENIIYGRWIPQGGSSGAVANNIDPSNTWSVDPAAYEAADGTTPSAKTLLRKDIEVRIKQYTTLFMYTSKAAKLYEDKLPPAMKKMAGQTMGLVSEKVKTGAFGGSTNKRYAGGTSRSTVDESVTNNLMSLGIRDMMNNRAGYFTEVIKPSGNYDTAAIEAAYLFFGHSDLAWNIRQLPDFTPVAKYGGGGMTRIHPLEIGSIPGVRFILSPEFDVVIDSGAAVGSTGLKSTSGTLVDVYRCFLIAEDAVADLALRGVESMEIIDTPVDLVSKSDPTKSRGYIGANWWGAAFVQNDGWVEVIECGAAAL